MNDKLMTSKKPKLSFWQIWNMSFGFLGIQFGFALQNANTSRIFETLGADTKNLAFYWLAAPVTGLIIQPIIGYWSDKTWHPKWGRRRPFFAVGAVLATISLLVMPNSPTLWIAIGMLWIMDGSINVSMEPFRAFVGDMLPPEQRTKGFAMQSFFIGIGAVVASALPWLFTNVIGLSNTAAEGEIPDSVKWSFYMGAFAFLVAVMWTVFSTKEYPPEAIEESSDKADHVDDSYSPRQYLNRGFILLSICILLAVWFTFSQLDNQLYVLAGIFGLFGFSYILAGLKMKQAVKQSGFVQIVRDFQNMPKTMVQLAYVQFFSWFALFAMWIYSTTAVTSHIYDMSIDSSDLIKYEAAATEYLSETNSESEIEKTQNVLTEISELNNGVKGLQPVVSLNFPKYFLSEERGLDLSTSMIADLKRVQQEYNTGADWIGILFSGYNGVAALAAFLLVAIAKRIGRKQTHMLALFSAAIGLVSFYFITDPNFLIFSMIGVGIAWASILSIPYAMLSGALPADKMGYYMGIFNFFIVIPQIVAASILGFLVSTFFQGEFIYAIMLGAGSMFIAGILALRVDDTEVQAS